MEIRTLPIALSLALFAPAILSAGEVHTTTQQTYQPPVVTEHIGWYLGAGIDYMFDAEDAFYNAHLGYDFGNGSSLFLESGWLGEEEDTALLFPFVSADVDIVPVTLNYKYEHMFTDCFGFYLGAGIGAANVDVSMGAFGGDEWVFAAQAFAGVVYNVSDSFEIYAGARYLYLDDTDLGGVSFDELDDVGVGAGIRFNF